MILFGDYHTHTKFSHGKNTILENVMVAKEKGIKEIAITDHGFSHFLFATKRKNIDEMRKQVKEAEEITGVKVYLGIECNFISFKGDIDLTEQDYEKLDIVLCGFHNCSRPNNFFDLFRLNLRNTITKFLPVSKKQIEKNTQMIVKALKKNKIDILTHLNYGMKVNTIEVAKAARDAGTYIELNGKRIIFTEEEIREMVKEKVHFIVNSDAHSDFRVGECNYATNLILKYKIPLELIANMDKLPTFHKIKER